MEAVRKQDPTFTNFVPRTAAEAVDRYIRCRRNGLKPMLVPECLITCAKGLRGPELDRFESWIINPNDDLSEVELVPETSIREHNDAVYLENVKRFEELPPVPIAFDFPESSARSERLQDDEKMPPMPALSRQESGQNVDAITESLRGSLLPSPAARPNTPEA